MKLHIFTDLQSLYAKAASQVVTAIIKKPNLVLGLAAGNTPTPLYKHLIEYYHRQKISFALVKTFNLDEFLGVSPENPASFYYYMTDSFLKHVDIKQHNIHAIMGNTEDIEASCMDYENKIEQFGGIDLQILGVGVNGHIAFNEPGSDRSSQTRLVTLTGESRRANQSRFTDDVPTQALTMGLDTILSAKKIILIATGEAKAEAVWHLKNGQPSKDWPCSWLQEHDNIECYLDTAAASKLQLLA